jgi:hypothetical protein
MGPSERAGYEKSREDYEAKLRSRQAQEASPVAAAEPTMGENLSVGAQKVGGQMAQNSAQEGNLAGTAGGALMMTGNPKLMAAGLGLSVLAAGEKNRRAQEEAQRQAYNDRIAERQKIMQQISQMRIQ